MAKTNEMVWNADSTIVTFTMNVSGGDLPKDYVAEIPVELNIGTDMKAVREYVAGGQSARVTMQGVLRKFKRTELDVIAAKGVKIGIADIKTADAYRDPEAVKAQRLADLIALAKAFPDKRAEILAALGVTV